jgi:hypothetical protein
VATHGAYPTPGGPHCERMAHHAGHESVTEYLRQQERGEAVLSLPHALREAA